MTLDSGIIDLSLNNAYDRPVLPYAGRHETFWQCWAVGEASTPGDRPPAGGQIISRSRRRGRGVLELHRSMEARVSSRHTERVTRPAHSRPPAPVDDGPAGPPPAVAASRRAGRRAHDRVVDPQAHRQGDRDTVRRPLQSGRRLEALAVRPRLELAETRTACAPARRGGHRTLENDGVAPYKKTPPGVGPTSCFSMKAAFC